MKSSAKRPTLDLHGFKTDDVYDAVDQFIQKNQSKDRVLIMTGKGSGAVQKKVIEYLRQAHYPWAFDKDASGRENTGVLVVFMS